MALIWTQEGPTSTVAQFLRRDIRAHRRHGGREGRKYSFKDLKAIHVGRDGDSIAYAVLTHWAQEEWQIWAWHQQDGWLLLGWDPSFDEAILWAENHSWPASDPDAIEASPDPGLYVAAGWHHAPYRDLDEPVKYNMRVQCSTKNTAIAISEIFHRLGCDTLKEQIG